MESNTNNSTNRKGHQQLNRIELSTENDVSDILSVQLIDNNASNSSATPQFTSTPLHYGGMTAVRPSHSTSPSTTTPTESSEIIESEAKASRAGTPSNSRQVLPKTVLRRENIPEGMMTGPNPADEEQENDDSDGSKVDDKRAGRRKIRIEYIEDKSRRHITFSKRKAGIMKKAYELSTLTGTQVLLLVASETGHVYTFATPKLQPLITKPEGKNLIQACLNAPDANDIPLQQPSELPSHYEAANEYSRSKDSYDPRMPPHQGNANYAAAMAGLAAYQYTQSSNNSQPTNSNQPNAPPPYLNPANYPAYAAQYNAAIANGYWPARGAGGISDKMGTNNPTARSQTNPNPKIGASSSTESNLAQEQQQYHRSQPKYYNDQTDDRKSNNSHNVYDNNTNQRNYSRQDSD